MARNEDYILTFNRGLIDPLALARADVKRVSLSAAEQMNFMPKVLGPMSIRPGTEYLGAVATAEGGIRMIPFVFSNSDKALIEVTSDAVRFWDDTLGLITRVAVSTTITNPNFDTDVTGWTDSDQGSAVSDWVSAYMRLTGTGTDGAVRSQHVTVAAGDFNKEHALRIIINTGTVGLRIGTTVDLDDLVTETYLGKGQHSIAFTPTAADVYIVFFNRSEEIAGVDSCNIESAGVLSFDISALPDENFDQIRWVQSGDVLFVARGLNRAPVKVERRSNTSWSIADYVSNTGPFRAPNTTPVTLTASGLTGNITITASQNYFKSSNVGSLFRITNTGQIVADNLGALNEFSPSIKITGVGDSRRFAFVIAGTWSGTVSLEQSLVEEGSWVEVASYTSNQTLTYNDLLDNQVAFYRLKMTAYVSGSADIDMSIATGSSTGVVRITGYTSPTSVSALVIDTLGGTTATDNWSEGAWSDRRGYPTAVAIFQSRLYWAGRDKVWGTVVDDFYNFDPDYIGDAGPLNRSIGSGPVETIQWLMPLRYLGMGTDGSEYSCRSNNLEDPITPTNFNLKELGTYGSSDVQPVKIDKSIVFMDKTGSRMIEMLGNVDEAELTDLTQLVPSIQRPSVNRMAVQRRPDTRIHTLRCDGTVVITVYDKVEEVKCFVTFETEGLVEDIVILPSAKGEAEDRVYYVVSREVNGTVVRYLERWALEEDTVGGEDNQLADSFIRVTQASSATITGLSHLEGKAVVVWANSKDQGAYTVTGGSITLPEATTFAVVGIAYYASYVSNKLGFATAGAGTLTRRARVVRAGLILKDTHANGLLYGTDADHLDGLPPVDDEEVTDADYIWPFYDKDKLAFNGRLDQDTRLYLRADSPRPCTVMAAIIAMEYVS